jgi:hypothetical protein
MEMRDYSFLGKKGGNWQTCPTEGGSDAGRNGTIFTHD